MSLGCSEFPSCWISEFLIFGVFEILQFEFLKSWVLGFLICCAIGFSRFACPEFLSIWFLHKSNGGVPYKCPSCSTKLIITSRGQSVIVKGRAAVKAAATAAALAPPVMQPPTQQTAEHAGHKRAAPSGTLSPATKGSRKASSNTGKQASTCGKRYCSLSWFTGQANPNPSLCARMRRDCYMNAVEMSGGQVRSLEPHGLACLPPAVPKELVPDRRRLSSSCVPIAITIEKAVVKVRKTRKALEKCNSQVLWLITDLERVCKKW